MLDNLILNTDSYKLSHFKQYPPGTSRITSYIEPRGGALPAVQFFGLQAFIKQALLQPITTAQVAEAEALAMAHVGVFYRAGWDRIVQRFGGYLPVQIDAVPEGIVLPLKLPLVQIHNTDPDSFWLVSYLETALLRAIWYPSTVASLSHACKQVLRQYLQATADSQDFLPFQLHDFGARGATGAEAAGLGGAGHLLNFMGTDTMSALLVARRYYGAEMPGFSIPAAEHSTMTSWGKPQEADAYRNMIQSFGGAGKILAFVADSYDLWNAVDQFIGGELKSLIQQQGGRVVVRPDSGDPVQVVPEIVERLMQHFGHSTNSKGYRLLPECVRVIQGDGITLHSLPVILEALKQRGLSTENVAFGMGGGLLQKVDRDTLKWAMKACEATVEGLARDVFKDPATDPGKRSKAGRQAVVKGPDGQWQAVREDALGNRQNLLRTVFKDGALLVDDGFEALRARGG